MLNTKNLPLVTIICNCYNHELFVWEALESVVKQTYTNIELIVINNDSEDQSFEVIQKFISDFPSTKLIHITKSISHNKAFNLAFKKSNGAFLIDLSGDDRLLLDCVENQINFFSKQAENVGLIFGNAKNIDEKGNFTSNYFGVDKENKVIDKNLFNVSYQRLLSGGMYMCSASAMMRRKHFELLNGYDENLFFEDLDYWFRLSHQYKIAFLDKFLVEKRHLNNSLGNQSYKINKIAKEINQSLRRIYKDTIIRNSPIENKALLKRIHYSIEQCYKNSNWKDLLKFCIIEIKCRISIYFKKSKKSLKSLM